MVDDSYFFGPSAFLGEEDDNPIFPKKDPIDPLMDLGDELEDASVFSMQTKEPDPHISSAYTSRQALIDQAQSNLLEASQGRREKLEEAKDLLKSGGNLWGSLITAAVPALIGGAIGGKDMAIRGGIAGFAGDETGREVGMKQSGEEASIALKEADAYRAEENIYRNQIAQNQTAQVGFQEREALQNSRYGAAQVAPDVKQKLGELLAKGMKHGWNSLTEEEMAFYNSNADRAYLQEGGRSYGQSQIGGRFDQSQGMKVADRYVAGYQRENNAPFSPDEKKFIMEERKKIAPLKLALRSFQQGKDIGALTGNEAAINAARSAILFQGGRIQTGSGANLTENEVAFIRAAMPHAAAGDLGEFLKNQALNRDSTQLAAWLERWYQDEADYTIYSATGAMNARRPKEWYSAVEEAEYGLVDNGSAYTNSPTSRLSGGGIRYPNDPEKQARYEKYLAAKKLRGGLGGR